MTRGSIPTQQVTAGTCSSPLAHPAATSTTPAGPFDLTAAQPLTGPGLYAGRVIQDRTGQWMLLAFRNTGTGAAFAGGLTDPIPVG
ncbi:MAG: hypothetical protein ABJB47_03930 [Actinomycetota bacterium]